MTDRIHSFTVFLAEDLLPENAEKLQQAIFQLRSVIWVEQNVSDVDSRLGQVRARRELTDALWDVMYPKESTHD